MGKETYLHIPDFPVTNVQGRGGYHAGVVNQNTYQLFEEVPSLGIAGDILMAVAQAGEEHNPNFPMQIPAGSVFTENLVGNITNIGVIRPGIRGKLASFGITHNAFNEYVENTRFNLKYLMNISDIIGKFSTYRCDKMSFKMSTISGGETQVVKSRNAEDTAKIWTESQVSVLSSSPAVIGAGYIFGFQLEKGVFNETEADGIRRSNKWSCIAPDATQANALRWVMPAEWYQARNNRRVIPQGVGTERFISIAKEQDIQLLEVSRRMVKTPR